MPLTWTIEVQDATTGTVKGTITPADHVVRIDSFEVFTDGDCGEANLTALADSVNINPRDVIVISTQADGELTPTQRYRGVCVLAGSPEGADPQRFRFAGLRSRFYEITTPVARIEGDDVSRMTEDVTAALEAASSFPVGLWGWAFAGYPLTGFVLGDRYPALESVGETLDALAEAVGAFIVPGGETYEYGGHTYLAGDVVPAVRWGVDAAGLLNLRRPAHVAPLAVSEASEGVVVRWQGISAERVVDRVRLVYAAHYAEISDATMRLYVAVDGSNAVTLAPFAVPLARQFNAPGAAYDSEAVIPLETPGDYMQRVTPLTQTDGTTTNTENAFDGNDGTYAEAVGFWRSLMFSHSLSRVPSCVVYVDVVLPGGASFSSMGVPIAASISIHMWPTGVDPHPRQILRYEIEPRDATERRRLALPVLPSADAANPWETYRGVSGSIDIAEGGRVHRFDVLVPEVELGGTASEKLASGYFIGVPPAVASVELLGMHDPVENVTLTPASGAAALDLHIERTEYAISTERGATTTYHAGQPYEGDLMAQRAVLDALAARAARKREKERLA